MFVSSKKACEFYGVHPNTLRRWAKEGRINFIRTPGKQRLYECGSLEQKDNRKSYCYCRVKSSEQKNELEQQIQFFKIHFPDYTILTDIGSGLDLKRPNFTLLLDECLQGNVDKIIVQNKDDLSQIAFDLIEWLFSRKKVKLIDLNLQKNKKDNNNISSILSILSGLSNSL